MTLLEFGLVTVVGIVAGIVNTLAGGGSLLTLPLLIFLGLPASLANGTNRVAVLTQTLSASAGFRSKGFKTVRYSLFLAAPAVIGSVMGAWLAVDISDSLFERLLGIVMLIMVGIILWNPTRRLEGNAENLTPKRKWVAAFCFLFVGFYGGFIQAGVGFFVIATLSLVNGFDLIKTNSHKVVINSVYIFVALLVFAFHGEVDWIVGFLLAIGMGIGGWLGSHLAVEKGEPLIRAVLVIAVVGMAIKLLAGF
ncbi:MAG: sulfite exporter TauE/SafE family protein [Candidatus Marinimicrobia bacterium]|nr:sulfite exporter TauE/SafE family protein [Candidatus Neomarinimicrobiota bacterium]MCF7829606.1 sulfite exporter TauE/SafE family protein [Candidatus Neomarinimicrobiota bacterium]MCF7879766.1 sulfite exporter TauE/SafE family protein [Candidatus Neomarinimicrobiota bacterium]